MIKITLNPMLVLFIFTLVSFGVLLYQGILDGILVSVLLFLYAAAMGLSYLLGYASHWLIEYTKKNAKHD